VASSVGGVTTPPRAAAGWPALAAVVVGGMLGTGLRLGIDLALPQAPDGFPWTTLLVNVAGSFALAVVVATVWTQPSTPSWLRAGLGAGLLGAFTTFSAVMVSLVALAAFGQWMLAVGYLVASAALGLGAAALGFKAGRPNPIIGADE
jgi:CrcB protein